MVETYTTDEALTAVGFGRFQALVLVYAGVGWVAESMELMLLSFVGPMVREEWQVSAQHESLLSSIVFFGMLLGSCAWGFVSDTYGRRTGLLFSTLFTTGMGFVSAFSPNYACLVALRFLVGVGVGGAHVFMSWFLEFVPAHNRGTWMVAFSVFWTLGTVVEASLAWVVVSASLSWRWLLALTALPLLLLLPLFGATPESPRYLCARNKLPEATLVLQRIAAANHAALPPGTLTRLNRGESDYECESETRYHLPLLFLLRGTDNDAAMSSKLRSLLSPDMRRWTLLLWFVFYAQSFVYYGLVLLTSQLVDANTSCPPTVSAVAVLFNGEHHPDDAAAAASLYKDTFVTSFSEIPGLILSAVLVEWFGRKATMSCLLFTCCAFLAPLLLRQSELWTTGLLFGARACAMGSSIVLCLYALEVYPTSVRSTGVGIASAVGKVGGVVCPLVAVGMLRSCHQMEAIIVFGAVLCLAAIACMLFPLDTKGRDIN
ncbi:unnamed protein product [Triticum turgidum subsp. durum]|uniref:Major facilitator superfamily (MFS) profile domain-containing protein n=1 Tax=Triticum turgidum subsp. durum TaxID=4567 RepID=A0A9R0TD05_TRITD|nr:unnamed protein product [Triticum turgidum subsp. durum]